MSKKGVTTTKRSVPVKVEDPSAVAAQVGQVREKVARRAFEIFQQNGNGLGKELDNWLAAEVELFRTPPIQLRQTDHVFTVEADVAGIDPDDLEVQVTPNELLIQGTSEYQEANSDSEVYCSEFGAAEVFRTISFPAPVDPAKVSAGYDKGVLHVTAPLASS